MLFKRNQLEEAIALTLGLPFPAPDLLQRLKRLLDADRALGRVSRSSDPEKANYAFYSTAPSGSGVEVQFTEYEVFALLTAAQLLQHGFPQQTAVLAMRSARPDLEKEHTRILRMNPAELFNQPTIQATARPGQLAVNNTNPAFVVISAHEETRDRERVSKVVDRIDICNDEAAMMRAVKARLGPKTILEIVTPAFALHHHLTRTEPRQRGRPSS